MEEKIKKLIEKYQKEIDYLEDDSRLTTSRWMIADDNRLEEVKILIKELQNLLE